MPLSQRKRRAAARSQRSESSPAQVTRTQPRLVLDDNGARTIQTIMPNSQTTIDPGNNAEVIPLWSARIPIADIHKSPVAQTLTAYNLEHRQPQIDPHAHGTSADRLRGLRGATSFGCGIWISGLIAGVSGAPVGVEVGLCATGLCSLAVGLLMAWYER